MISLRPQRGMTLIELMIALTLGLIIVAAGMFIMLSTKRSFQAQEGLGDVQEGGRNGLRIMTMTIRQAGYLNNPIEQLDPTQFFANPNVALMGTDSAPPPAFLGVAAANVRANTDSIMISSLGTADGGVRTCLGDSIAEGAVGTSAFYLTGTNPEGISSLACVTDRGGVRRNEPLVVGVQDMQLRYGIDFNGDRVADSYRTATGVTNWNQVVSVQVDLTIASQQKAVANTGTLQDGGRLLRRFRSSIAIRNRLSP